MDKPIFKDFLWSLFFHFGILIIFSVKYIFLSPAHPEFQKSIRVDIVDLPDKYKNFAESIQQEPSIPKMESTKNQNEVQKPPPPPTKEPEVSLKPRSEDLTKQQKALQKLKEMRAFEEIEKQLKKEKNLKSSAGQIKGAELNKGSELTGVALLQHTEYVDQVGSQIRQNWELPSWLARKSLSAQAQVKVDEGGNIVSKQIVKSSGNPEFDNKIIEAIQKSTPLPPPPKTLVNLLKYEGILLGFPE